MQCDFDLSQLKPSRFDLETGVITPHNMNKDLAHFLGIHFGDGHLSKRENKMIYNGHYVNENFWYQCYLSYLIKKLFNIQPKIRKGHNSIELSFYSKSVHIFLSKICGLPIGSKKDKDIPLIIKRSDHVIKSAFLKGLADTDVSLTFRKGRRRKNSYPVIDFRTQSKAADQSILNLLNEMGFRVHHGQYFSLRNSKPHLIYYFQINGRNQLFKWVSNIGFTNFNQLTRLWTWEKIGYLPPGTSIKDRMNILCDNFEKEKARP